MTTGILVTTGIGKFLVMELRIFTWDSLAFEILTLSSILVRVCGEVVITLQRSRALSPAVVVTNFGLEFVFGTPLVVTNFGLGLVSQILGWNWCHKF